MGEVGQGCGIWGGFNVEVKPEQDVEGRVAIYKNKEGMEVGVCVCVCVCISDREKFMCEGLETMDVRRMF